ncbi:type IV pilus modification protein PilV [Gilvimarinus sp. SDUM040013]|uniref:Type IV pilus modification protein PilV n=1 Tax=Gilvimarinus gilvus TaxID=3058038 RepID=A0ABU4S0L0_9GAMM|nr:type IV pilus modification protein PilV [Gilvimarinus sp. SDUM040013]MDO3384883.1 type IV pilus modification protein PilV [Gilvimarinus sp. SDUM040013]MDX6850692.1 type IV pilus modification protein PilV [Gilvimarinus sp. SDUM040013]
MNNLKKQCGVGMIEVLITALILSTGLMAIAALQTRSIQYNSSAYLRSQANIIAYDILDQLRAGSASEWDGGAIVEPDNVDDLVSILPDGEGAIECVTRVCTVSITWTEPVEGGVEGEGEEATFEYTSRI